MDRILQAVREAFGGVTTDLYSDAVYLVNTAEGISKRRLEEHLKEIAPVEISATRIDQMTDRLAYVQAEYSVEKTYRRAIVGLIFAESKWQVVCVTEGKSNCRFENLYGKDFERQCEDLARIENILLNYCHSVYHMNTPECLNLFWEGSRMYHPNGDETFTDVEIQVLRERWDNMPSPESKGIDEYTRIFHVEMLTSDTAIAKIGCAKLEYFYNDYLSLMKLNGSWKIVNKMTQTLHFGNRI